MRRRWTIALLAPLSVALVSVPGSAGPEKITFPANYRDHVLYATVDRYDNKQYRELYSTPEPSRRFARVSRFRAARCSR